MSIVLAGELLPSLPAVAATLAVYALVVTAVSFVVSRLLKVSFGTTAVVVVVVLCSIPLLMGLWGRHRQKAECEAGDHRQCDLVGIRLMLSEDPAEHAQGIAILRRECEQGQTGPCGTLAYEEARSSDPATLQLALSDYEKSCGGGSKYGCGKAGRMHLVGPAPRDATVAARFLNTACSGTGQLPAECADFAELLLKGDGIPRDAVRAAGLNRRVCDEGGWDYRTVDACRALAEQYSTGDGVPKDAARAQQLLARARAHSH